jgi:hypothetical protein
VGAAALASRGLRRAGLQGARRHLQSSQGLFLSQALLKAARRLIDQRAHEGRAARMSEGDAGNGVVRGGLFGR